MGMYDSVYVICPACNDSVEFQSKAGECCLRGFGIDFGTEDIPVAIAEDLDGDALQCECGKVLTLVKKYPVPEPTVTMEVKISDY